MVIKWSVKKKHLNVASLSSLVIEYLVKKRSLKSMLLHGTGVSMMIKWSVEKNSLNVAGLDGDRISGEEKIFEINAVVLDDDI